MRERFLTALLLALPLTFVACGDDDSDDGKGAAGKTSTQTGGAGGGSNNGSVPDCADFADGDPCEKGTLICTNDARGCIGTCTDKQVWSIDCALD